MLNRDLGGNVSGRENETKTDQSLSKTHGLGTDTTLGCLVSPRLAEARSCIHVAVPDTSSLIFDMAQARVNDLSWLCLTLKHHCSRTTLVVVHLRVKAFDVAVQDPAHRIICVSVSDNVQVWFRREQSVEKVEE
jgi:hypothetical protein